MEALIAAQANNVIHRDIKPTNIMVILAGLREIPAQDPRLRPRQVQQDALGPDDGPGGVGHGLDLLHGPRAVRTRGTRRAHRPLPDGLRVLQRPHRTVSLQRRDRAPGDERAPAAPRHSPRAGASGSLPLDLPVGHVAHQPGHQPPPRRRARRPQALAAETGAPGSEAGRGPAHRGHAAGRDRR